MDVIVAFLELQLQLRQESSKFKRRAHSVQALEKVGRVTAEAWHGWHIVARLSKTACLAVKVLKP